MSINAAFENIEQNDGSKSADEMFDELGQEVIATSYAIIRRKKDGGPGMTSEEKQFLDEAQYQLQIIEKVFYKLKKNGRIAVKPNEKFDQQLHEKIKQEISRPKPTSSVGNIVQMIPQKDSKKKKDDE